MKHLFKSLSVIALGLAALQAEAKFKVVTTFTVIQDIAQNVAGDAATVESITKPGAFLCGQGEFEQAYSQFNAALAAPNYYHQADTYENIALCAFAGKQTDVYQQALDKLRQVDPSRVEKLRTLK